MSNYTKSFNFRNGVQVDDSNFIVNSVGLVGIGTTRPEKRLDVRGNASITGITNLSGAIISGVVTSGNIKIDSVSGIVTATKFVGDASGLTNIVAIATAGFIANASGLSTTSNIGIGSETPTTQLDVIGNSIFTGTTSFIGLTTTTDLIVQKLDVIGVSTFGGAVDINNDVNISSGLDVSGSVTLRDDVAISADNKTFKIKTAGSVDKFVVDTNNGNTDIQGTLDVGGDLTVGDGSADSRLLIKKADNNVSDHLQFYYQNTRMGEIGVEDTNWLRINQETNKNIYTPRYIRADSGFFVDDTTKGINGSGNFIGGTIAGASDYDTLLRSDTNDTINGELTVGGSAVSANEGGQINVTLAPNSSLNGSVVIDQYIDQ